MLAYIRGTLTAKSPTSAIVEASGIGYEIFLTLTTFEQLPAVDQVTCVCTHLIVREDQWSLFGFADDAERNVFRALIKISGIGPKMAIGILANMTGDAFVAAINDENISVLRKIPGIGPKTAQRVALELKGVFATTAATRTTHSSEVAAALLALGYKSNEISRIAPQLDKSLNTAAMLRQALQQLAK